MGSVGVRSAAAADWLLAAQIDPAGRAEDWTTDAGEARNQR